MRVEYREEPCRSALNRVHGMMFEWSLNPYMGCAHRCTFCYVRAFERRADRPVGRALRDVDPGQGQRRRGPRARAGAAVVGRRERSSIGAATDPYQPAEGRYRLTRSCLEVFAAASNPFSIITRGPMIVRDIDVLAEASRRANVSVTFSIPTLDEEVWRKTEPSTAHPRQRLRALRELVDAGVDARVGMAPILPGLSDRPEQLAEVVRAAREAGATGIWANVLYLRPGTREHFLASLARDWPEELPRYERLYAGGRAYLPKAETQPGPAEVARLRVNTGFATAATSACEPPAERRATPRSGRVAQKRSRPSVRLRSSLHAERNQPASSWMTTKSSARGSDSRSRVHPTSASSARPETVGRRSSSQSGESRTS